MQQLLEPYIAFLQTSCAVPWQRVQYSQWVGEIFDRTVYVSISTFHMINLFNITYVHWAHSTVAICRTLRFHVLHRPQSDSIPCVVGFRNGTMMAEDWHQLHREAAQVAMLSTKAQRKMPVLTWKSCEDFGNCPNINKFQFQKAVALHVTYLHHVLV